MAASNSDTWKRKIVRYFGKACGQRYRSIIMDILVVDLGVKPSFLFDYACVTLDMMRSFLTDAHKSDLLSSNLCILQIDDDIFIIHKQALIQHLKNQSSVILIDVSSGLDAPQIVDPRTSQSLIGNIRRNLLHLIGEKETGNSGSIEVFVAGLEEDVNRTTVFGLLLGYPVLYWYSPDSTDNCLGMMPLCVYQTSLMYTDEFMKRLGYVTKQPHLVHSFSVPALLQTHVKKAIEEWWKDFHKNALANEYIQDGQLKTKVVALPAVAL